MKKYLVLIVFLLVFLSCDEEKNDLTGPSEEKFNFPLAIGNWWEFERYRNVPDKDEKGQLLLNYRSEIVDTLTYDGNKIYIFEKDIHDDVQTELYSVVDNVIYYDHMYGYSEGPIIPNLKVLYNPNKDSWTVEDSEEINGGFGIRIKTTGNLESKSTVSFRGKEYISVNIKHKVLFEIVNLVDGDTVETRNTFYVHYKLVNGIGIFNVKDYSEDKENPGIEDVLTGFNIID